MMVVGGNMLVALDTARTYQITAPAFAGGAFEDVDFQLRLTAGGLADRIRFDPQMTTDYHDQLTARSLLRMSVLSGQGLAGCRHLHGPRLWQLPRWKPGRPLTTTARALLPPRSCEFPRRLQGFELVRTLVAPAYGALG
ncbi:hypothetical protein ACIHCV_40140 [Streptomyces sp. NPDC051956]|uniref:hypothetical protein n=1 Tax=Streptomyces sp. NPDC051956 TaxID=3365677 RepID=UPI0037D09121